MPFTDINGGELIVLVLLALVFLGPDRLPEYASQLARLIRRARDFARGARDQVREELGPEFDEIDWRRYDPRQYHPRAIVRNALSDVMDDDEAAGPAPAGRQGAATMRGSAAAAPTPRDFAGGAAVRSRATKPAAPRPDVAPTVTAPSPAPTGWDQAARDLGLDADAT